MDTSNQNRNKHGDPGPFLVCAIAKEDDTYFLSSCIKCNKNVVVPESMMVRWRNSGSVTVCEICSGGKVNEILDTF